MFKWLKNDKKENDKKLLLEVWKQCVDVQMHFNDMEMKIRSLAVTVITAISGAIGYLLKENLQSQIEENSQNHFWVIYLFVGAAAWICFYLMDRFMYHKLLIGAVKAGIETENELKNLGINVALGTQIKEASPIKNMLCGPLEMHSNQKLDFFYIVIPCICINGILTYLKFSLYSTIIMLASLIIIGIYIIAKEYNNEAKRSKIKCPYFVIFILFNLILFIILLKLNNLVS